MITEDHLTDGIYHELREKNEQLKSNTLEVKAKINSYNDILDNIDEEEIDMLLKDESFSDSSCHQEHEKDTNVNKIKTPA